MVIQTNNRAKKRGEEGRASPKSQYRSHPAGSGLQCFSVGDVKALREVSDYCNTITNKRKTPQCVVGNLNIRRENSEGNEAWHSEKLDAMALLSSRVREGSLPRNMDCSDQPFTS